MDRPRVDWLAAAGELEVPVEHRCQSLAPVTIAADGSEHRALPGGAGPPGCSALRDHLEQPVCLGGRHARMQQVWVPETASSRA